MRLRPYRCSTRLTADGGRRDGKITGDLRAAQALLTQGHDGFLRPGRCRTVQAVRPRGAILQPDRPFGVEAGDPLAHRLGAHAHRCGHRLRNEPAPGQPHKALSIQGRQTRILVDVHSGLSGIAEASNLQRPRLRPDGQPPESSHLSLTSELAAPSARVR